MGRGSGGGVAPHSCANAGWRITGIPSFRFNIRVLFQHWFLIVFGKILKAFWGARNEAVAYLFV